LIQEDDTKERTELLSPIYFRASTFAKFSNKLQAIEGMPAWSNPLTFHSGIIAKSVSGEAVLGEVARTGGNLDYPLARFSADISNPYYRQVDRIVNDDFPYSPPWGGCPEFSIAGQTSFPLITDAAGMTAAYNNPITVGSEDFANGQVNLAGNLGQRLKYEIPKEMKNRFEVLTSQITSCADMIVESNTGEGLTADQMENQIEAGIGNRALRLLQEDGLPAVPEGYYRIKASYVLPDGRVTSIFCSRKAPEAFPEWEEASRLITTFFSLSLPIRTTFTANSY